MIIFQYAFQSEIGVRRFVRGGLFAAIGVVTAALVAVLMIAGAPPAQANNPPVVPPTEGEVQPLGSEAAPVSCPSGAPAGSVLAGLDVRAACEQAVAQATSYEAAAAIRYGFAKLGTPYSQDPNLRATSHFDCSSFVGRAMTAGGGAVRRYNGQLVDFFPYFGWTGAYVPVGTYSSGYRYGYEGTNVARVGSLSVGDIIIQFNGSNPANSAGNAGHALIYLGNGRVIQAGRAPDGSSKVSVVNYTSNGFSNQWYFRYNTLTVPKTAMPAVPGGSTRTIATGMANAAVYGTLAVVNPQSDGYITAYPCAEGRPAAVSTNFLGGLTTSAFVLARSDANGKLCFYTSATTDLVFDKALVTQVMAVHNARRMMDTRPANPVPPGGVLRIQTGAPGKTVVGALSAVAPVGDGYLTPFSCDTPRPLTSALNYSKTRGALSAGAAVRADAQGMICVYSSNWTHVLWDQVSETITLPGAAARRLADTRTPAGGMMPVWAGHTKVIDTGALNKTVLANLTVAAPATAGFMTAYPCDVHKPHASVINFAPGQTVSTMVPVKSDPHGNVCIYSSATTHVIWDQVVATDWYIAGTPVRMMDTRT